MKCIRVINTKVFKGVMFCDSNFTRNKDTIKRVSSLADTFEVILLTFSSNTQKMITLSITKVKQVALLACAHEVNLVNMLQKKISEVQKPSMLHNDNQEADFLSKNRQVVMRTQNIDMRNHFMRNMVEEQDTYIKYIKSKKKSHIRKKKIAKLITRIMQR